MHLQVLHVLSCRTKFNSQITTRPRLPLSFLPLFIFVPTSAPAPPPWAILPLTQGFSTWALGGQIVSLWWGPSSALQDAPLSQAKFPWGQYSPPHPPPAAPAPLRTTVLIAYFALFGGKTYHCLEYFWFRFVVRNQSGHHLLWKTTLTPAPPPKKGAGLGFLPCVPSPPCTCFSDSTYVTG